MSTFPLWVTQKELQINMYQVINDNRFIPICCKGIMLKTSVIFLHMKEKRVSLKCCLRKKSTKENTNQFFSKKKNYKKIK